MTKTNFFKQQWQKFKKFYNASSENRIGFYAFLGFTVIPIIGLTILYIFAMVFWVK